MSIIFRNKGLKSRFVFLCTLYTAVRSAHVPVTVYIHSKHSHGHGVVAKSLTFFATNLFLMHDCINRISLNCAKVYAWIAVFVLPINSSINPILYTLATPAIRKRLDSIRHTMGKPFSVLSRSCEYFIYCFRLLPIPQHNTTQICPIFLTESHFKVTSFRMKY